MTPHEKSKVDRDSCERRSRFQVQGEDHDSEKGRMI